MAPEINQGHAPGLGCGVITRRRIYFRERTRPKGAQLFLRAAQIENSTKTQSCLPAFGFCWWVYLPCCSWGHQHCCQNWASASSAFHTDARAEVPKGHPGLPHQIENALMSSAEHWAVWALGLPSMQMVDVDPSSSYCVSQSNKFPVVMHSNSFPVFLWRTWTQLSGQRCVV